MLKGILIFIGIAVAGMLIVLFAGRYSFKASIEYEIEIAKRSSLHIDFLDNQQIAKLPAIVRKYVKFSGLLENEYPETIRAKFSGKFKTEISGNASELYGELYSGLYPFRLWWGEIKPYPLVEITASDVYRNRIGHMQVKLMSVVNLSDLKGTKMNISELLSYLSELPLLPSLALDSRHLKWKEINDSTARATIFDGDNISSGIFKFAKDSSITEFETLEKFRAVENGKLVKTNYRVNFFDYKNVHGIKVPSRGTVSWMLTEGEFKYIEFKIDEIQFNSLEIF